MKAQTSNHWNTAKIILGYLALVLALAFLFTSCTIERDCPGAGKGYVGYTGKPAKAHYGSTRHSY